MRVLAIVQSADHVCCRYRVAAFAGAMAERGIRLELSPIQTGLAARLRQIRATGGFDVVLLQRRLLPAWQLVLLRRCARRLVFDFDDAVFQRDSFSRKPAASAMRLLRFWAAVYSADAVLAGNAHLAGRAAAYVGTDRVHVLPTCLEPQRYRPACHVRRGSAARLVWIGQESTLPSLDCARRHLAAAAARLGGLELRAISDRYPELRGVRCIRRPWSEATEAAELAECDVGVSWLPDDDWSRGKCGLKVLQYMAAGLPVVANPVGMNLELVTDGRTGFLASTPREWADAIARLAEDPELRHAMGVAGRRLVEEHFNASRMAPQFARLIAAVAGQSRVACRAAAASAECRVAL